jgi:hypothetical protein
VCFVVGDVAIFDSEDNRNLTIGANREVVEQLFEIGPVILVVAPRDGWSRPTSAPAPAYWPEKVTVVESLWISERSMSNSSTT